MIASKYLTNLKGKSNDQLLRRPIVRQDDFNFEDYPFLDPEYNKNIQEISRKDDPSRPLIDFNGASSQTYWTDMFLYWLDDAEVVEGSIIAFFQDISQDRA